MTCIDPAPRAGCAILHLPPGEGETGGLRSRRDQWLGSAAVVAPEDSYFKALGTAFRLDDDKLSMASRS